MGECQSNTAVKNGFSCKSCSENTLGADNFCLSIGCKICPLCDFCSTKVKHNSNSDLRYFSWLFLNLKNSITRDAAKYYDNFKFKEISDKFNKLLNIWETEPLISTKKFEWLDNIRETVRDYFIIPKIGSPKSLKLDVDELSKRNLLNPLENCESGCVEPYVKEVKNQNISSARNSSLKLDKINFDRRGKKRKSTKQNLKMIVPKLNKDGT